MDSTSPSTTFTIIHCQTSLSRCSSASVWRRKNSPHRLGPCGDWKSGLSPKFLGATVRFHPSSRPSPREGRGSYLSLLLVKGEGVPYPSLRNFDFDAFRFGLLAFGQVQF